MSARGITYSWAVAGLARRLDEYTIRIQAPVFKSSGSNGRCGPILVRQCRCSIRQAAAERRLARRLVGVRLRRLHAADQNVSYRNRAQPDHLDDNVQRPIPRAAASL